mmetsp:Transcript_14355/g.45099  ORF Transcript_14355/g.45099 Transcript_14355/m.45099 type:complete len:393 (+) Transcript_14355:138-1316(+)
MPPRLGFGAHRISTAAHASALRRSLDIGVCGLIDTSPNYGESERIVGRVVREWREHRGKERELTVVTKVGVLQGADLADARERELRGRPWPGVLKLSPDAWHCISPEYIEHSVWRSSAALGSPPDVVLLHNPEFFIADQLARGRHTAAATSAAAVAADDSGRCEDLYDGFYARLGDAFAALAACHGGRFGVSSNLVGCRYGVSGRANDAEAVELAKVVRAAEEGCGAAADRCSVVQLPVNLLEPDAVAGSASAPVAEARARGFTVLSHRPLHAIPPAEGLGGGFGLTSARHLTLRDGRPTLPAAALVRNTAREALAPHLPDAASLALEDIALLYAMHAPAVDVVLTGMRSAEYVDAAARLLRRPPLSPEAHADLTAAMLRLISELQGEQASR